MTDQQGTPKEDTDVFEVPADFYFRTTGITGTVTLTLQLADGQTFNGSATADLEEDKIGEGLGILASAAARFLGAASGSGIEDEHLNDLDANLGLKPPEEAGGDA